MFCHAFQQRRGRAVDVGLMDDQAFAEVVVAGLVNLGFAAAKLAVFSNNPPVVTAAQSTVVRVAAGEGMSVSCDATTFSAECSNTGWTFSWDGVAHRASKRSDTNEMTSPTMRSDQA